MTKLVFDIVPAAWAQNELLNSTLLIEIGEKLFGYVVYNKEQKQLLGLRQYHLDVSAERSTVQALHEIIAKDGLLQQHWKEAVVIYNFPDSNLLPDKFFDIGMNKSITELVYGNAFKGLVLSEKVQAWEVYNVYRIQRDIHSVMQQKFAGGRYWHYYSMLLASINNQHHKPGYLLKCIFYPERFIVAFFKERQLQLMQTYRYETPEDVAYYLLLICKQFNAAQENLILNIAGLIERQSALYTELLKYFAKVEWDQLPETVHTKGLLQNFPGHYFSPLLKMALCV